MITQRNVIVLLILALLVAPCTLELAAQETAVAVFDLGTARLEIDAKGFTTLDVLGEQHPWPVATNPIVRLDTEDGVLLPESVTALDDRLVLQFAGDRVCALTVAPGAGFAVFEVTRLDAPDATRLRLLSLPVPEGADIMPTLNAVRTPTHIAALSAAV